MSGLPPRTDEPKWKDLEREAKELFRMSYFDTLLFAKTGVHLKALSEATTVEPTSPHEAALQAYIKHCVNDAIKKGAI